MAWNAKLPEIPLNIFSPNQVDYNSSIVSIIENSAKITWHYMQQPPSLFLPKGPYDTYRYFAFLLSSRQTM